MSLNSRIAEQAIADAHLTLDEFIREAVGDGWPYGLRTPKGKRWASCCMSAGRGLKKASGGKLGFNFGQPKNPKLSRYVMPGTKTDPGGNASVPQVYYAAKKLGILVPADKPAIGFIPLIQVRHADESGVLPAWGDHPHHVGRAVVELLRDTSGKIAHFRAWESNYGGRNALVKRPLASGPKAHERVMCYINPEAYEALVDAAEGIQHEAEGRDEDHSAVSQEAHDEMNDVFVSGHEFEGEVVDGLGRTLILRCVADDVDGGFAAIEIDADGNMVGDRVYRASEWLPTGAAHGVDE